MADTKIAIHGDETDQKSTEWNERIVEEHVWFTNKWTPDFPFVIFDEYRRWNDEDAREYIWARQNRHEQIAGDFVTSFDVN